MKMKKMFVVALMAIFVSGSLYAQNPEKKQKPEISTETQAKKKAVQLMLDDATTAKFIPLYQEYLDAMKANRESMRTVNGDERKERGGENQLTDEELDKMITSRFECQQKRLDIQQKYYNKFKKILTVRQAEKLFKFGQPGIPGHMSHKMQKPGKNAHAKKSFRQQSGAMCPQICPQTIEKPE